MLNGAAAPHSTFNIQHLTFPVLLFAVAAITFVILFAIERVRPLRQMVESWPRRIARNLTVGGIAFVIAFPIQLALLVPLSRRGLGLLPMTGLAPTVRTVIAVVLLDY